MSDAYRDGWEELQDLAGWDPEMPDEETLAQHADLLSRGKGNHRGLLKDSQRLELNIIYAEVYFAHGNRNKEALWDRVQDEVARKMSGWLMPSGEPPSLKTIKAGTVGCKQWVARLEKSRDNK